jgi:hypothetical protein
MIEEHMLPLVGEQQRIFENNLKPWRWVWLIDWCRGGVDNHSPTGQIRVGLRIVE